MLVALLSMWPFHVQPQTPRLEYEVKAAYLLNFTRYVTWPAEAFAEPSSPVVIGVYGADPFGAVLERTVAGRTSRGRAIEVRRTSRIEDLPDCHVLFLSRRNESRSQQAALRSVRELSILTVGETRQFLKSGGALRLVVVDDTVQFEVDLSATDRADLRLSSRMLHLAYEVLPSVGQRKGD